MEIKILHPNEMLSNEEAINIKGGLNASVIKAEPECTCDCFISNSNSTGGKSKPTK